MTESLTHLLVSQPVSRRLHGSVTTSVTHYNRLFSDPLTDYL